MMLCATMPRLEVRKLGTRVAAGGTNGTAMVTRGPLRAPSTDENHGDPSPNSSPRSPWPSGYAGRCYRRPRRGLWYV